jgi:RNA polymerase sigma-70 factor, ECF subfamily
MKESILIEGLHNRDKIIFDYIFNYYYSGLCVYSMRYLENHESTKDLVQDFFVQLWIEGPRLQINTSLKAYLFTSIKNRCLDTIKHQYVKNKYRSTLLSTGSKSENSTELMIAEAELRTAIQNCLEKLTPRCREIFELSRINGNSNQEIADKLGLSKRTVELQISNAIKILRNELANYLPAIIISWMIR